MNAMPNEPSEAAGLASGASDDEALVELFRSIRAGSTVALEGLYDATARTLYGLALWRTGSPEDAADVVQEVFVRVARQRERLGDVRSPRAWLLAIAHRLAVDVARRRSRRREDPPDALELVHAPAHDPGRTVDAQHVSTLLTELPSTQREAVYLRHFQDLSFALIGDVTGVPTFTAASRYRLGIARLRRLLEARS